MIAIAIVGFPFYTRLVRGVVLSLREREFVEAARALGAGDAVILGRHVLPHLVSPIIVAFSLDVGAKILITAGLSFLGLGTQPPTADWGSMLATGRQFVILSPHVALLPGLAIFLIVLALNVVGDALRDVLDPRTRPADALGPAIPRMTKRERVLAAVAGRAVDPPPVTFWQHVPGVVHTASRPSISAPGGRLLDAAPAASASCQDAGIAPVRSTIRR
jgi:hypothetical protein